MPELFRYASDLDVELVWDLGDALATQLLQLLAQGVVRPGGPIVDLEAITARIGRRSAAARWGQGVIQHVAARYGLLRYRPRGVGDPIFPIAARTHAWEVSDAALALRGISVRHLRASAAGAGSRVATGRSQAGQCPPAGTA